MSDKNELFKLLLENGWRELEISVPNNKLFDKGAFVLKIDVFKISIYKRTKSSSSGTYSEVTTSDECITVRLQQRNISNLLLLIKAFEDYCI